MSKYTPRIPLLDLKSLLTQPTPQIDLKISIYEESTQNFLRAVNTYKNRSISMISERRVRSESERRKVGEKAVLVEGEIRGCKVREIELMGELEKEGKERKDAELSVAAFKRQLASLNEKSTAIQAQIDEYRAIAASLKREKGKERTTLSTHASRASPEVEELEELLGCVIEGVEKDQLLVRFRRIDVKEPEREFSFILDVSSRGYKVLKTSPTIPTLPVLVERLEVTRDIFEFIVVIRQEFEKLVNGHT